MPSLTPRCTLPTSIAIRNPDSCRKLPFASSQLKPDHQKFWYDTMLRETAAALLGRSAATEDEAQQGAA